MMTNCPSLEHTEYQIPPSACDCIVVISHRINQNNFYLEFCKEWKINTTSGIVDLKHASDQT
jgi:hypothetical protein